MNKAAVYTRVSSEEQVHGTSLETQEKMCREYCERQGLALVRIFTDAGESAKTADRPEFKAMLLFCANRANGITHVVAYRFDRVSRQTMDFAIFSAELAKYGIQLVSATEPSSDDPTGRFMKTILSAVAQLDNEVRAERSRHGMLRVVEKGGWPQIAPVGYKLVRDGENIPILLEDPETGPLIRRMFELIGSGHHTVAQVHRKIVAAGLVAPSPSLPIRG